MNLKVFDYKTNTYISLERKNYVKYLGVLIDETLSWKYHIRRVAWSFFQVRTSTYDLET